MALGSNNRSLPESKSIWRRGVSQVPQERGCRVWDTIWRRRPWDTSTWSQDSPPGGHRDHRVVIGKCTSTLLVGSSDPSPRTLPFSFCLSVYCCLLAANVALVQVSEEFFLVISPLILSSFDNCNMNCSVQVSVLFSSFCYSIFSADYWSIAVGGFMLLWCESKEGHCVLKPPRTSRYCLGQSRPLSTHGLSINPARPRSRWSWTSSSENRFLRFHRLGRNSIGNQFDIHKSQLLRRGCSARKRQVTRSTPRMLKILENIHF